MDKFTRMMLEQGLFAMVGKAERGPMAIEAIKDHKSAYLMAVGGSAYLVARAIKGSKIVGFEDLGMRSEEHTSELQSLMRISYAVFCLKKKTHKNSYTCIEDYRHLKN